MIETLALSLAAVMIPTVPMNTLTAESYSGYGVPTEYVKTLSDLDEYVYTPNGTKVHITHKDDEVDEQNIERLTYFFVGNDNPNIGAIYSGKYTNLLGSTVSLNFANNPDYRRIGDPTTTYNCLTVAFYMYWEYEMYNSDYFCEDPYRRCELLEPEAYLRDMSFEETNEPRVNDLALYYDANGGVQTAGIIREVYAEQASNPTSNETFVKQLSQYKMWSKWGEYGVYEHRGDHCPYIDKLACPQLTNSSTTRVMYLRKHTHSYTQKYVADGDKHHKAYCKCGDYSVNPHIWIRGSNRQKYCEYCFYRTSGFPFLTDTLNLDYNDVDYKSLHKN